MQFKIQSKKFEKQKLIVLNSTSNMNKNSNFFEKLTREHMNEKYKNLEWKKKEP